MSDYSTTLFSKDAERKIHITNLTNSIDKHLVLVYHLNMKSISYKSRADFVVL